MQLRSLLAAASAVTAIGMAATGVAGAHALASPGVVTRAGVQPAASIGTGTSYEAGYATATAEDATLSATVVVPKLKCTSQDTQPVFYTIGLYGDDVDNNFEESGGSVIMSCQSGDNVYNIIDDSITNSSPVNPGDTILVTVEASPSGDTESYTDESTGATSTASGSGFIQSGAQTTMQGAFGNAGKNEKFPQFTGAKFTGVTVDGAPLGSTDPAQFYQEGPTGKTQIKAGAIAKQANFADTWISG